jgi:hypothetical protein
VPVTRSLEVLDTTHTAHKQYGFMSVTQYCQDSKIQGTPMGKVRSSLKLILGRYIFKIGGGQNGAG